MISGFSAVCVIIWGVVMHTFVDDQNKTNIDENTAYFSSKNDSNYFDNTKSENSSDWKWDENQKTNDDKCWKGYSNYPYLWIITGPMTLVIFVRIIITLFLILKLFV